MNCKNKNPALTADACNRGRFVQFECPKGHHHHPSDHPNHHRHPSDEDTDLNVDRNDSQTVWAMHSLCRAVNITNGVLDE